MFNGTVVAKMNGQEDLCLILDSDLSFKIHLNEKLIKAKKNIGIIKHLSIFLPHKTLDLMYKALVRSPWLLWRIWHHMVSYTMKKDANIWGTWVVFFLTQLLLGIMLLLILMIFHLSVFLKTIFFLWFGQRKKCIFGIHDLLELRHLFQLRVVLSSLRYHKNVITSLIPLLTNVFVIRVLRIRIPSYFCVLFCYSTCNVSD